MWSALLGVGGAIVGAIVSFLGVWWQTRRLLDAERERAREAREEERRDILRRREEQALANLLPVLSELQISVPKLYALGRSSSYMGLRPPGFEQIAEDADRANYIHEALLHGLRVDIPLIATQEVRDRYRALVELTEQLAALTPNSKRIERQRGDLIRYISYVRHAIKNALNGEPIPAHTDPPVLVRDDKALWSPLEIDPEDAYFIQSRSGDPS
jgi:hypothetical protein